MENGIRGIGCDIVSVHRIRRLMETPRFPDKVYTPYERAYISGRSARTAAGIWAAKEAVSKALGTGFSGFTLKDIEIRHTEGGQPYAVLYNGAAAAGAKRIHISISHEAEQAMAFAVAE